MTWRRTAPWVILITLLLAIFIDLPRQTLGLTWLPSNVLGKELKTVLGLDLQGGIRVTLAVTPQSGQTVTDEQVETARNIIERRVGGLGVSEPQVRTEVSGGDRRIDLAPPGGAAPVPSAAAVRPGPAARRSSRGAFQAA